MIKSDHLCHVVAFSLPPAAVILSLFESWEPFGFTSGVLGCLIVGGIYCTQLDRWTQPPQTVPWVFSLRAGLVYLFAELGLLFGTIALLGQISASLILLYVLALPCSLGIVVAQIANCAPNGPEARGAPAADRLKAELRTTHQPPAVAHQEEGGQGAWSRSRRWRAAKGDDPDVAIGGG